LSLVLTEQYRIGTVAPAGAIQIEQRQRLALYKFDSASDWRYINKQRQRLALYK
jgi:hypothetical protein